MCNGEIDIKGGISDTKKFKKAVIFSEIFFKKAVFNC